MTPEKQREEAWEALHCAVANSYDPKDDDPPGDTTVTIDYDRSTKRYNVWVQAGETEISASGPTLELALMAMSYCDEGESVTVDRNGVAICAECNRDGCNECGGKGLDPYKPHAWPEGGLLL